MQESADDVFIFPRTPATIDEVEVNQADEIAEMLIMGLRLTQEGISRDDFVRRFGRDILNVHPKILTDFEARGLIEITPDRVRLTSQGRLLSNLVFRELI
jgi:oxygen-independent coproporphyrinogen-3 oxidase